MPKYAVVICPDCRNPFIIEPGPKSVSCRHCNKRHETANLRTFFATDDFHEAQKARGSINARICGDPSYDEAQLIQASEARAIDDRQFVEDKRLVEEKMLEEARQTRTRGQQAILQETFEELAEKGDVPVEEYRSIAIAQGISEKKFEEWMDRMLETGAAYSPRHGYLKKG